VFRLVLFGSAAIIAVRRGVRPPLLAGLLAAAAAWGVFQQVAGTTVYAHATLEKTLDWLAWASAAFVAFHLCKGPEAAWRFARRLAVFGGALAAVALVTRFTAEARVFWFFDGGHPGPWMGPFRYENQYAAFIELALPPAIVLPFRDKAGLLWAPLAALMIASVLVSGSVAGAGLVLVETLVLLLLLKRRLGLDWTRVRLVAAALALPVLIVGAVAGLDALMKDLRRQQPFQLRNQLTASTIEMAMDRPWTGFGFGAWPVVYPAYARFDDGMFDNQAHNDWAQWAAEGGVPLLLLMAGFAVAVAGPAIRSMWGIGLLFVLAHCAMEYHFQQRPGFGCLFFAMAGACASGFPRIRGNQRPTGTGDARTARSNAQLRM
jgi:O-antigen ligase